MNLTMGEKERLEKNWNWCKNYFERKNKEFNLKEWIIKKDNAKTTLGKTNYKKKQISISTYFLRGKSCDYKAIRNTILHEIAHVIVGPGFGHGKIWKLKAIEIGCDGKIYSKMDKPPGDYLLYCPNKCFKKEYYKKPKIEGKKCIKCKSVPKIKKLIKN